MNKTPSRSLEDVKEHINKIKKKQNKTEILRAKLPASFKICTEIFSGVIAGLIIGRILDYTFNTDVVFTVISLILGCITSFMVLYRMMNKR